MATKKKAKTLTAVPMQPDNRIKLRAYKKIKGVNITVFANAAVKEVLDREFKSFSAEEKEKLRELIAE